MPDYSKGKIYAIRSPNTEQVYIGSTTQALSRRIAEHKNKPYETKSKIILEAGDAYIELIEEFPCDNKEQLNKREGEVMRATPNCINKQIAGRTHKESVKAYKDANKEKISEAGKVYREKNREKYNQYQREYRVKKSKEHPEQEVDDTIIQGAETNN